MTTFKDLYSMEDFDIECEPNHITGNGELFETYGDELAYVLEAAQQGKTIFTEMDSETTDEVVIRKGMYLINRIGYFIAKETA